MNLTGYFTKQGLQLSSKLLSGSTLKVTRVVAGSGKTGDPLTASSLPQTRQTLAVNSPTHSGETAIIPATLAAAKASEDYTLTELGIYASDPDKGEILYKLYRLSESVDIVAGSRTVLRFYLEETVSQDLGITVVCSPAGLITEEQFSDVRSRVEASVVRTRSVTVSGADLADYISGLPKLVTENLIITVSGDVVKAPDLRFFYGSGRIIIRAENQGDCVIRVPILMEDCRLYIQLENLSFQAADQSTDASLTVYRCPAVFIFKCTFAGTENATAISAGYQADLRISNCSITNYEKALVLRESGMVDVENVSDVSGNTIGVFVYLGGIVLLTGSTPNLLGGSANQNYDGLIVSSNGTLL